ncbi:MAG: hypothetical protein PUG48_10940 [Clostridia bacterium]|nr:hypothetical protein [Clostridia bacterium]
MTLIPCDENCIYQSDGYCQLETISIVTDCTQSGCVHKITVSTQPQKISEEEHSPHL